MVKFNRIALVFLLVLQISFFSLIKTTPTLFLINSYVYKPLIIFLIICLLIFNFIFNFSRFNQVRSYQFLTMMIGWVIIYLLLLWGSQLAYNQSLLVTIKNSYIYAMVVLYFLLIFIFNNDADFKFILNSISYIGVVYAGILIVQAVLLKRNLVFLDLSSYGLNPIFDSFGPVFHFIRVAGPSDFISFSILITAISSIFQGNKNLLVNTLILMVDYFYIVFVSGTRMYMIIDFLILITFILFSIYKKHSMLVYSTIIVGCVSAVGIIPILIKVFTSGARGLSFEIRMNEIKYYLGKFFYNGWFGIGFPDSKRYDQILHGTSGNHIAMTNGNYFVEDIGILGIIAIFGILGIIAIAFFIYKLAQIFIDSRFKRELLLIGVYLISTTVTLSFLDSQRIFYLFIIIYIIEYLSRTTENKILEELQ